MSDTGDQKLLSESLATVKTQLGHMRRCLDSDQLMDALKAASTMLAELRTEGLGPKMYYELYMAVFDALRHLSSYLHDAHLSGRHHLADLYELVQYAGNIVPRLYLMITVGSVYMSIPEAPVKEIMRDMMEMSRGVQHPIRGLFLRHYLSGMTRDNLPIGNDPGPVGNLTDSIGFVVTNFMEMNKLWVRLQHTGPSRERERRELERKELRILVGTNLVRLSQLEGVDLAIYERVILPAVLEQVVNCRDVIAQEYLMEVVIQVFSDAHHLATLQPFLSSLAHLNPKVNIKTIVISLIDRLAGYAKREGESDTQTDEQVQELVEKERRRLWNEKVARNGKAVAEPSSDDSLNTNGQFRGIPGNVKLFEIFWEQVGNLIKARIDLSIQDTTALLLSLLNLSLTCYPTNLSNISLILTFAESQTMLHNTSATLHHPSTISNLLQLLISPIQNYKSTLTLLVLDGYKELLTSLPWHVRRKVALAIVESVLKNETIISDPEEVDGIFKLCDVLMRDQKDRPTGPGIGNANGSGSINGRNKAPYDIEEMAEEQGWIARMIHLFKSDDLATQFKLLQTARKELSPGGDRIRWTFPPLIISAIKLTQRYKHLQSSLSPKEFRTKLTTLFKFINTLIFHLYTTVEASEISLRLHLLALSSADTCGMEELAYEFAVQAFTIYEESISESRAQLQAITLIIGTLQGSRVFGGDNYDTLITKAALHGAKLLKKGQQATAVGLASHLWWQIGDPPPKSLDEDPDDDEFQPRQLYKDGKRVLECLQKSLRIATSSIDELTSVQLYCDALDQYLYYFERGVEAISAKHINSLIELINTQIDTLQTTEYQPQTSSSSAATSGLIEGVNTPEAVIKHFRNTLVYIQTRKDGRLGSNTESGAENKSVLTTAEAVKLFENVEVAGPLLKMGIGSSGKY